MSEKGLTTIALKKIKPFQNLPIHLPEQTDSSSCRSFQDLQMGSVHSQPEF
ncbi:MAG: hypothetical protein ACLURP_17660 [Ruminococcus sp.]